jgi:hypothetical protein
MFIEEVSPELAAQIESCEVNAWLDMYEGIPSEYARQFQPVIRKEREVVFTHCKTIPFVHFNCVKNLGMNEPASESLVDDLISLYHQAGVRRFTFYHIPHNQPPELTEWLKARGFHPRGGWDRIYRPDGAGPGRIVEPRAGYQVEKVTKATASEWAAYLDSIYGLPTTPWLLALADRPGWHHYLLRRGEQIAAVRTMYVADGMAWLGVEAPVPGIMAPSFDLDAQLCQAILEDGMALGAKSFVADIEAPTPTMDTPAYRYFDALGFRRPYFRSHYSN